MKHLKLYKTPRSVGSDLQVYVDDDGNKYIRCRFINSIESERWHFQKVDFDTEGNLFLDPHLILEENVEISRPPEGRSALDTMPPSFA